MFRANYPKFVERDTQVLGISTDPKPTQTAYAASLGNLPYPLLSDFHPKAEVSNAYDLYNEERGTANRAVLIIDKTGTIRYRRVYDSASDIDIADFLAEIDKF
jgi:alkyl hydroperoxide reductase subunit AhpC